MNRLVSPVLILGATLLAVGCATPRLAPVALPGTYVSQMGCSLTVEKEDIALEVLQGSNPAGSGSDLVTFLLIARNTSGHEVELLLDRAVLLDGMGVQYESIPVHELRIRSQAWTTVGWSHYHPWGWYGMSYPVTVTERASVQDRNFPKSPIVILPHSQVRGCFFFPCSIKNTTYVQLFLTRLIREKEEPGSSPDTVRTTYRKLKYEYEFNVTR
ncbi:MAG: hypothetical protein ABIH23_14100 [bacterium]